MRPTALTALALLLFSLAARLVSTQFPIPGYECLTTIPWLLFAKLALLTLASTLIVWYVYTTVLRPTRFFLIRWFSLGQLVVFILLLILQVQGILDWLFATDSSASAIRLDLPLEAASLLERGEFVYLLIGLCCVGIGFASVLGGIGGGLLFLPLAYLAFPQADSSTLRIASLALGLCAALVSSPIMLKQGYLHKRLLIPLALCSSLGALIGASLGISLSSGVIQLFTPFLLMFAGMLILKSPVNQAELLGRERITVQLGLFGTLPPSELDHNARVWSAKKTSWGLLGFFGVGLVGSMFGLGAGWANVPLLVQLMRVPLKTALATSLFIVAMTNTSSLWVYLSSGKADLLLTACVLGGGMAGAALGNLLFVRLGGKTARRVVVVLLFMAAVLGLFTSVLRQVGGSGHSG